MSGWLSSLKSLLRQRLDSFTAWIDQLLPPRPSDGPIALVPTVVPEEPRPEAAPEPLPPEAEAVRPEPSQEEEAEPLTILVDPDDSRFRLPPTLGTWSESNVPTYSSAPELELELIQEPEPVFAALTLDVPDAAEPPVDAYAVDVVALPAISEPTPLLEVVPPAPRWQAGAGRVAGEEAREFLMDGPGAFNAWRISQRQAPLWLGGTKLRDFDLRRVDWKRCVLVGVDFTGADLRGATFKGAVLRSCRFQGACVEGVDFSEHDSAELLGLDLTGPCPPQLASNRWWRPEAWLIVEKAARIRWEASGVVRTKVKVTNRSTYLLPVVIWLETPDGRAIAGSAEVGPSATVVVDLKAHDLVKCTELAATAVVDGPSFDETRFTTALTGDRPKRERAGR